MPMRLARLPLLPCLLAGALAVRVAAAIIVQHWVDQTPGRLCLIEGDAQGYWELARHIARGEEYAVFDPPRAVHRMPGFPLVLAGGIKLFGENILWIRMLLAVLGTAACGLVYWLGRDLIDPAAGRMACFLAAISPTFIAFSVLLLSETVFALTLLASLIAFARLALFESPDVAATTATEKCGAAAIAGLLAGAATLVRPTWLLVVPAFAAIYFIARGDRRSRLAPIAFLLAALALALAPWTIRNYRVTGHFIPTTLWAGPSLYDGLSAQATGDSDMRFIEIDGLYARRGVPDFEYQADRHYRRLAFDFVRDHPLRTIELAVRKLARFFNPLPNADQFGHWAVRMAVGLFELPVLLLAAVGGWTSRRELWRWLLAAGPVLYFAAVHAVFIGSVRYRLPAEYALLVLVPIGWHSLFARPATAR